MLHKIYIEYLLMKVTECDWHAVADAANDLRVLEAKGELNMAKKKAMKKKPAKKPMMKKGK